MTWYQGFFGAPREVAKQLYGLPAAVVAEPYYALLLHSGAGADVRVFVRARPGDAEGEVRDWLGDALGDLPERLVAACWAEPGDGRRVVDVLDGFAAYSVRAGISCPPTARGAFGHQLRRHEGQDLVRALVVSCPAQVVG